VLQDSFYQHRGTWLRTIDNIAKVPERYQNDVDKVTASFVTIHEAIKRRDDTRDRDRPRKLMVNLAQTTAHAAEIAIYLGIDNYPTLDIPLGGEFDNSAKEPDSNVRSDRAPHFHPGGGGHKRGWYEQPVARFSTAILAAPIVGDVAHHALEHLRDHLVKEGTSTEVANHVVSSVGTAIEASSAEISSMLASSGSQIAADSATDYLADVITTILGG